MMTSSHAAVSVPKSPLSTRWTLIASGTSSKAMILDVRFRPISQICGLARSRNENTKVLANSIFGSSPSKPRPETMLRMAWNTRFPSSSAQPTARKTPLMSSTMGTWVLMYAKSSVMMSSSDEKKKFQTSRIRL